MKLHTTDQNQRLPLKAFWSQEVEVIEITTGLVHSTFLVVAGEDRFILQRVNTNVFKEADQVLANIAIVTQHLSSDPDYHLQVPEVVSTLDGRDSITTADESHWRCFSYIKGSTSKT
ncbi:MAG: hypothetical protein HKN76_08880, partial [Saprospiraceae bacterium]|nr:hypothetical protein [Saprospiraceae bacterium]